MELFFIHIQMVFLNSSTCHQVVGVILVHFVKQDKIKLCNAKDRDTKG